MVTAVVQPVQFEFDLSMTALHNLVPAVPSVLEVYVFSLVNFFF